MGRGRTPVKGGIPPIPVPTRWPTSGPIAPTCRSRSSASGGSARTAWFATLFRSPRVQPRPRMWLSNFCRSKALSSSVSGAMRWDGKEPRTNSTASGRDEIAGWMHTDRMRTSWGHAMGQPRGLLAGRGGSREARPFCGPASLRARRSRGAAPARWSSGPSSPRRSRGRGSRLHGSCSPRMPARGPCRPRVACARSARGIGWISLP